MKKDILKITSVTLCAMVILIALMLAVTVLPFVFTMDGVASAADSWVNPNLLEQGDFKGAKNGTYNNVDYLNEVQDSPWYVAPFVGYRLENPSTDPWFTFDLNFDDGVTVTLAPYDESLNNAFMLYQTVSAKDYCCTATTYVDTSAFGARLACYRVNGKGYPIDSAGTDFVSLEKTGLHYLDVPFIGEKFAICLMFINWSKEDVTFHIPWVKLEEGYEYTGGYDIPDSVVDYKAKYEELLSQYNVLLSQNSTLQFQLDSLQTQNSTLQSQLNELQSDYNHLHSQYDTLEHRADDYYNKLQTLRSNYTDLQSQFNSLQNNYDKLQNDYDTVVNSNKKVLDDYLNLRSQYTQLQSSKNELQLQLNELQASYDELRDLSNKLQDRVDTYEQTTVSTILSPYNGVRDLEFSVFNQTYSCMLGAYTNSTSNGVNRSVVLGANDSSYNIGICFPLTYFNSGLQLRFDIIYPIVLDFESLYVVTNSHQILDSTLSDAIAYDLSGYLNFAFFDSSMNYIPINVPNSITSSHIEVSLDYEPMYIAIYCTSSQYHGISWYGTISGIISNTFGDIYNNAFSAGVDSVDTKAYYNEGYRVGQEIGYANGVADQGDYSFFGLISSVIDAPIKAFRGLLDFNVLGVDMASFMLSLFSVALILCVIKLILGR